MQEFQKSPYVISREDLMRAEQERLRVRGYTERTGPQGTRGIADGTASATAGLFKDTLNGPQSAFQSSEASRNSQETIRTFFVKSVSGTTVSVSAGAINNVAYAANTIASVADGDKIYIDCTVTSGTDSVTAVTVSKAASVPADTATHAYTLLATIAVSGGSATVTPVAWNYSQLQKCGTFLWGGFGGS